MTQLPFDTPNPMVRIAMALRSRPGAYALLLGAGVSIEAGIKPAWEVLLDLVRQVAHAEGFPDIEDPERWWTASTGSAPTYSGVLARLANTPEERQAILSRYFAPGGGDPIGQPSETHQAIARLVRDGLVRVVLTTNFDRLIERSLQAIGVEPVVIASPDQVRALEPLHAQRALVVHLHGDYLHPDGLNTTDELGSYLPEASGLVAEVFRDYGVIVAGWSAIWDMALASLWEGTKPRRYSRWWIEPSPLNERQLQLATARTTEHVQARASLVLAQVADYSEALRDYEERLSPVPAALAVSLLKRELTPEARISSRAHDMLHAEFDRMERWRARYQVNRVDRFDEIVDGLLETSETALAMIATLAYWGNEQTDEWWIEAPGRLGHRLHESGDAHMVNLARGPALLVMYTAGVAAMARGRHQLGWRLLSEHKVEDQTGAQRVVIGKVLTPEIIGRDQGSWKVAEALEPVFVQHLGISVRKFVEAWERFEMLHHIRWQIGRSGPSYLGWQPLMRCEGIGPAESAATAQLWLEDGTPQGEDPLFRFASNEPAPRLREALDRFSEAFVSHVQRADDRLIAPGGGWLPSARRFPGTWSEELPWTVSQPRRW